jgi:hypothetical protein
MEDFLLFPATGDMAAAGPEIGPGTSVRYGRYILTCDDKDFRAIGEWGIFIKGYVMPRNDDFDAWSVFDQHEMVARLYGRYGKSFTDHIKGYFIVIILKCDVIELFFDHYGLFRAFYHSREGRFIISGSVRHLKQAGITLEPDRTSLAMQSLFHRVPSGYTVFRDVYKTTSADYFRLADNKVIHERYHSPGDIFTGTVRHSEIEIERFADLFLTNAVNLNKYLKPKHTVITLTGGKDSRTLLAALLGAGISPEGLTYGSGQSSDAIYGGLLAAAAGIDHKIIEPPSTEEWFESQARAIIAAGNPEINIHRSHRNYAFDMVSQATGRKTAFYAGYMGGELLMGIYYDDLIFTAFLSDVWKRGLRNQAISDRLEAYFVRNDPSLVKDIHARIDELMCMDKNIPGGIREFYGLFEIGIPHHSQDLALASRYWDFPFPAYLDTEFLQLLFSSRHSFLEKRNGSVNPFRRHRLYELNMMLQHILYPGLDNIPFGKRGSYNNLEYMRGPVFWSIVRGYRYIAERRSYPPSFSYGFEYRKFLKKFLLLARSGSSPAKDFYSLDSAITRLENLNLPAPEKVLHRFSDIVMFHMTFAQKR